MFIIYSYIAFNCELVIALLHSHSIISQFSVESLFLLKGASKIAYTIISNRIIICI